MKVSVPAVGFCQRCGKNSYVSRKVARAIVRRRFPGERLQAYRCPHLPGVWHGGHVAPEVASGEIAKQLFYGPQGVGEVRRKQGTRKYTKKAA
ncbi:hypothetical protein [Nocardia wallacei]|uniref:hypothetical protein n=1 Tax=Nocardia wallacei TaxID=480035 RepID=UPI002457D1B0|nr:hypothetical protein [Nocardia wallacei]